MAVYQRAVVAVDKTDKMAVFNIYLKKAAESYGVTMTRSIYEKAIEVLEDMEASDMCLRFADMETKLGEIDRLCSQIWLGQLRNKDVTTKSIKIFKRICTG